MFMIGAILFVMEFKLGIQNENILAQLFLELLCAYFLFIHTQY